MKSIIRLNIFLIGILWADGGFIPPSGGYEISSADQAAIIRILPDGEELMILARAHPDAAYQGFAWVIPLPSRPLIEEVDVQLFVDIANLTVPVYEGAGCSGSAASHRYRRRWGRRYQRR